MHRTVFMDRVLEMERHIIITFQSAFLVSDGLVLLRMIASHSIDVSGEGGIIRSNKDGPLGCNQLVQHAVVIGIDPFDQSWIAIQEINSVVRGKNLKEGSLLFIGGNVQHRIGGDEVLDVLIDFVGFDPSVLGGCIS
jgi:hypothetical protein